MGKIIKGVGKDEPIETNKQGGKQSASPYAMHLIDPQFMKDFMRNDDIIYHFVDFMQTKNKLALLEIITKIQDIKKITSTETLLEISKVRKEASLKYPPQNWRLIPQEEHLNHALVHYLAYKSNDTQDEHLEHCMCRLMFAYTTEPSKNFSYTEHIEDIENEKDYNYSNFINTFKNSIS